MDFENNKLTHRICLEALKKEIDILLNADPIMLDAEINLDNRIKNTHIHNELFNIGFQFYKNHFVVICDETIDRKEIVDELTDIVREKELYAEKLLEILRWHFR